MLIPKNIKGKHFIDDWNSLMQKTLLKTAAVLSSILKSFQNIFRGFCKYFAERNKKHYT